jgi:predicted 3-demethylubiquinone-9 3-methyltransferase (glyoxalase superfamily)
VRDTHCFAVVLYMERTLLRSNFNGVLRSQCHLLASLFNIADARVVCQDIGVVSEARKALSLLISVERELTPSSMCNELSEHRQQELATIVARG